MCIGGEPRETEFDLVRDADNQLARIIVVLHYSKTLLDDLMPVFGLDAGHTERVQLKIDPATYLKQMYITLLTSRLPGNKHTILAFMLSYVDAVATALLDISNVYFVMAAKNEVVGGDGR